MYLTLSYFHSIRGPRVVLSFPDSLPENIRKVIISIFNIEQENPFFEYTMTEESLKITNLFINIPSEWARGNNEMVMVSVVDDKDHKSDYFYDLLNQFAKTILSDPKIYKSFYVDSLQKEDDSEIEEKYIQLKNLVLEYLKNFEEKRKELEMLELLASKDLSLSGASNLFGVLLPDILSCLLQQKEVVLYGDKDASVALFKVIKRVYLDILPVDSLLHVEENLKNIDPDVFSINTSLRLIERGEVCNDAHGTIKKYLQDAEKTGDNEAAIISLRQSLAILLKVAEYLDKALKEKKAPKKILKDINSHMKIKLKVDELQAIKVILQGQGKSEIAERIALTKMDNF